MPDWKRNFIFIWISQFCSLTGFSLALPFAPFFIQNLGITDPDAVKFWSALSVSSPPVGMAIMAPIWGYLADRYGRKMMMLRANFSAMIILFGWAVTAKSVGWFISPLISGSIAVGFGIPVMYLFGLIQFWILIPIIKIVSNRVLLLQEENNGRVVTI